MAGWFRKGPEYYTDKLIASQQEFSRLSPDDSAGRTRVSALMIKYAGKLKDFMYGDGAKDPVPGHCERLARAWLDKGVLTGIRPLLQGLDFESRKLTSMVFCALVRGDHGGFASSGVASVPTMIRNLVDEYADPGMALVVGPMIRESLRVPAVHAAMLRGPEAGDDERAAATVRSGVLEAVAAAQEVAKAEAAAGRTPSGAIPADFEARAEAAADAARAAVRAGVSRQLVELLGRWTTLPQFEAASDAFATLTWILRERDRKEDVNAFLLERSAEFFPLFMGMLEPWSGVMQYTVQLQALKLLAEVLLDRDNFEVMVLFIQRTRHLRAAMKLLRSRHTAVQFEAFHVFKIFVANPRKPHPIVEVLLANRDKLVAFLRALQNDRQDDDFHGEKALLIETLEAGLELPEGYQAKLLAPREAEGLDRPGARPPAALAAVPGEEVEDEEGPATPEADAEGEASAASASASASAAGGAAATSAGGEA